MFYIIIFPHPLLSQLFFAYHPYYLLLITFFKWFSTLTALIIDPEWTLFCIFDSFHPEKTFIVFFFPVATYVYHIKNKISSLYFA